MNNKGYTLIEILITLGLIAMVTIGCLSVWAIMHFVAKFW